VSGAQEKFRANPTPEAAMEAHQQLMNFHQLEDAAAFRKMMREKYADNAKVHAYLGTVLERFGQQDEATACYQRAFELRPDLPEARIGVARGLMQAGKLTEARALLDFMEKPGAAQLYSLEPLDTLARACQRAERHEEALALFAVIQRELPKLTEQRWFRDLIYKSEKVLKRPTSQVPKQKFSWKRLFAPGNASTTRTLLIAGVLLSLVVLGFVVANEFIRRHRTVHVVSAYKQAAKLQIDGGEPVTIHGLGEITLAEGRHRATISGPLSQVVDFEIAEGYWSRWFSDPAWVLNVGGAAIVTEERAHYAAHDAPPVDTAFYFGENFQRFAEVTHPFKELPEKISVSSGETKTLIGLDVFQREPYTLFYYFAKQRRLPEAMRLAEWRLRQHPEDEMMLTLFAGSATKADQVKQVGDFLRTGLTNRPVLIPWHRYYQSLHRDKAHAAELAAQYAVELQTDPTNSALLYLLGRVVPTRAESRTLFERACAADTNNAFAFYACAYDRASLGDWAGARQLLARACALRPEQLEFAQQFATARFALGEFADLEKELRAQLQKETLNQFAAQRLCDVLVAQGRADEALTVVQEYRRAAAPHAATVGHEAWRDLQRHLLYARGDFAGLEKDCANSGDEESGYNRFVALIEMGRAEEAIKLLPAEPTKIKEPYHYLTTALALRTAGNATEADHWLATGITILEQGDSDMTRAAAVLRRTTPPAAGETEEFSLQPEGKAVILAVLAQKHPAARGELIPLIEKLNVVPGFPQHLIRQTIATLQ